MKGIEGSLTWKINELTQTVNTHTNLFKEMAPVIEELVKDSHPPVQFEECIVCSALVPPGKMHRHLRKAHPD